MDNPYAAPPTGTTPGDPRPDAQENRPRPTRRTARYRRAVRRFRYRYRPDEPPRPVDPETARAVNRLVLHFALLMLAALATASLPLPWQVGSMVFTVIAIAVGLRALRVAARPGLRERVTPLLVFGLVFAVLMSLSMGTTLALWPIQMAHQECLGRAVTITARQQCEAEYDEAVADRLHQLRSPAPG